MSDKHQFVARPTEARSIYESHIDQYRKGLAESMDHGVERFGFVFFHSLQPHERVEMMRNMGLLRGDAIDEYNLGTIEAAKGNLSQAKTHLEKALALDPEFFDATYQLAAVFSMLGDLTKARQLAQKALDMAPDSEAEEDVKIQMESLQSA